ncbi:UNVERIFIED_ORG: hypothetical protein ABIB52_002094 [Arthrobacter sp. UYCu721]
MTLLGGKSVARRSMQLGASVRAFTGHRLAGGSAAAAACTLLAAFGLSACEYADSEPLPGASTAALPQVPGDGPAGPSAQEEARQLERIADVEAQLGPETDRRTGDGYAATHQRRRIGRRPSH